MFLYPTVHGFELWEPRNREPLTAIGVADACRSAGLEFMAGVAEGWNGGDFVRWFVGSYHRATCSNGHANGAAAAEREPISSLMGQAREHVLRALERHAFMEGRSAFIGDLLDKGALMRGTPAHPLWIPVDSVHLALRDRVLSLFAADALMRPKAYQGKRVCSQCGDLSLALPCACARRPTTSVEKRPQ